VQFSTTVDMRYVGFTSANVIRLAYNELHEYYYAAIELAKYSKLNLN